MKDAAILTLLRADDRYTVTLEAGRQGPLALAGSVWLTPDHRREIIRVVDAITTLINRQSATADPYRSDVSALQELCEVKSLVEFGQLLYGLFLPPIVQNALRDADLLSGSPLVIATNDAEIPWELLHDGNTFLSLRGPVVRRLLVSRWVAGRTTEAGRDPYFLLVINPLSDLDEAEAEADRLVALLDARNIPYDLLRGPRATYMAVQQAFMSSRYQVIHYAGHVVFDPAQPERSGLQLAGEHLLPTGHVEGVLRGHPLVFLNACASGRGEKVINNQCSVFNIHYTGPQTESLASAFLAGGASGFLGTQWPIFDAGSRDFSLTFYQYLLNGEDLGTALHRARADLFTARPHEATWASFLFYGDPALRLTEPTADLLQAARNLANQGAWNAALTVLDQVQRRDPAQAEAIALREGIATAQLQAEQMAALYAEAQQAIVRGDWAGADDRLGQILAIHPTYRDAPALRAECQRQAELADLYQQAATARAAGHLTDARVALERLLHLDPGYRDAAVQLAQVKDELSQREVEADQLRAAAGSLNHQAVSPPPSILRRPASLFFLGTLLTALIILVGVAYQRLQPPSPAPTPMPTPTSTGVQWNTPTPTPTAIVGPHWQRLGNLQAAIVRAIAFDPANPRRVWAGTWGGGVFRSGDSGETWQAVNLGLSHRHIWDLTLDPQATTTLFVATSGGGVYRSEDGGDTWTPARTGLPDLYVYALAITPRQRHLLFAATSKGKIAVSGDSGRAWQETPGQIPSPVTIHRLVFDRSGLTLYAGTNRGVYISNDYGASWQERLPGDVRSLAVDPLLPRVVYAGLAGAGVYKSSDDAQTWKPINKGLDNIRVRAVAVDPNDPNTLYAGTDGGRVFKSSDGGESWSGTGAGLANPSVQALAAAPGQVYAGTWGDGVFVSGDSGNSWRPAGIIPTLNVNTLVTSPSIPHRLVIAIYGKGVFGSDDGGLTWQPRNQGLTTSDEVLGLGADPAITNTLYAHTAGGLFKSRDGGLSWQANNTGLTPANLRALAISPADPQRLYLGASDGTIFASADGGELWQRRSQVAAGELLNALVVEPRRPTTVMAGTNNGLYLSRDGGITWQQQINQATLTFALDPTSHRVYAATWPGGLRVSSDEGNTWLRLGLPNQQTTALLTDPERSDTLYAATPENGVQVSNDGGRTWVAVDGGLPDAFVQALAWLPGNPRVLLAGTAEGLYAIAIP